MSYSNMSTISGGMATHGGGGFPQPAIHRTYLLTSARSWRSRWRRRRKRLSRVCTLSLTGYREAKRSTTAVATRRFLCQLWPLHELGQAVISSNDQVASVLTAAEVYDRPIVIG